MRDVAVVIPALDEEASIGTVVRAIPREVATEIIVVDNGSSDATAQRATEAGARVVAEPRRGYGAACAAGVAALPPQFRIVVFLDGDGSDVPDAMAALVEPIRRNRADFVIGSRVRGKREAGSLSFVQILAGRLAGAALYARYRVRYSDMGPFRAIDRDALDAMPMTERTYGWNLQMQILAARRHLRVLEIPVAHRRRTGGVSKVSGNLRAGIVAATRIVAVLLRS